MTVNSASGGLFGINVAVEVSGKLLDCAFGIDVEISNPQENPLDQRCMEYTYLGNLSKHKFKNISDNMHVRITLS